MLTQANISFNQLKLKKIYIEEIKPNKSKIHFDQPWGFGVLGFWGFGFSVLGSGLWVQGSGFSILGSGFWVQGSGFRVLGLGFWVQGSGLRVLGSGFWV